VAVLITTEVDFMPTIEKLRIALPSEMAAIVRRAAEWKSTQRNASGACWAERGATASIAAIKKNKSEEDTNRMV
jgi:hypothetical protein